MTVLSRGARVRRGGRRPGWPLLTTLLVLAIGASCALVFTNRVELLKLAVILALWAAAAAAFVSVIYRRQSDADQARTRDLKLVYDLQLDREISARREYELTVESQLRRELTAELQSHAADEVAALRAELAALRTNLEIWFDTDFDHQPALETERGTVRAYSDREDRHDAAGREVRESSIRMDLVAEETAPEVNPIIDVPEVPPAVAEAYRPVEPVDAQPRWHQGDDRGWVRDDAPRRHQPPPERPAPWPAPPPTPAPASRWQPVGAEGEWLPPGTPGSNWVSGPTDQPAQPAERLEPVAPSPFTPPPEPRGRHWSPPESPPEPQPHADVRRGRHAGEPEPRHRGPDTEPPTGGQSVADLLARLQAGQSGGGGRRRRRDE